MKLADMPSSASNTVATQFTTEEALAAIAYIERLKEQRRRASAKSMMKKRMAQAGCSTIEEYDAKKKCPGRTRKHFF